MAGAEARAAWPAEEACVKPPCTRHSLEEGIGRPREGVLTSGACHRGGAGPAAELAPLLERLKAEEVFVRELDTLGIALPLARPARLRGRAHCWYPLLCRTRSQLVSMGMLSSPKQVTTVRQPCCVVA